MPGNVVKNLPQSTSVTHTTSERTESNQSHSTTSSTYFPTTETHPTTAMPPAEYLTQLAEKGDVQSLLGQGSDFYKCEPSFQQRLIVTLCNSLNEYWEAIKDTKNSFLEIAQSKSYPIKRGYIGMTPVLGISIKKDEQEALVNQLNSVLGVVTVQKIKNEASLTTENGDELIMAIQECDNPRDIIEQGLDYSNSPWIILTKMLRDENSDPDTNLMILKALGLPWNVPHVNTSVDDGATTTNDTLEADLRQEQDHGVQE